MRVRPKVLYPDTNTFLDAPAAVVALARVFTVAVPMTGRLCAWVGVIIFVRMDSVAALAAMYILEWFYVP